MHHRTLAGQTLSTGTRSVIDEPGRFSFRAYLSRPRLLTSSEGGSSYGQRGLAFDASGHHWLSFAEAWLR